MSLVLNTLSVVAGMPGSILSGSITQPAGTNPALTNAERDTMLDALNTLYDGGKIEIWTAAFGDLLYEFTLNTPAYDPSSGGTADLDVTGLTENGLDTGTAAVYRFVTSGATNGRTGTVTT